MGQVDAIGAERTVVSSTFARPCDFSRGDWEPGWLALGSDVAMALAYIVPWDTSPPRGEGRICLIAPHNGSASPFKAGYVLAKHVCAGW